MHVEVVFYITMGIHVSDPFHIYVKKSIMSFTFGLFFGYVQWFSELDILLLEKFREINKQIKNDTMVLRHENALSLRSLLPIFKKNLLKYKSNYTPRI